ncbi:MAG: DUF1097 domain-containing protein [Mycobacterium sp.]
MNERAAATLVIGVLGAASFLVTIYVVTVPIWALFIAWASFVAAGGGVTGLRRSLPMAVLGIVSATATLLVAHALGGGPWATALCIVFGAGVLVAIGRFDVFSFTPASFFGFASTVGIIGATGRSITDAPSISHPAAIALMAMVLGTAFGFVAEQVAGASSRTPRLVGETAG